MKKQSLAFLGRLSNEDEIFASLIFDRIQASRERYRTSYTFFLDENRSTLARQVLASQSFESFLFYGGHENASRVMLGIFSELDEPSAESFPLRAVAYEMKGTGGLTHRDFLGALMALGITRESVGDILVSDNSAVAFVTESVFSDALYSITRVGRVGVKAHEGFDPALLPKQSYHEITGTVSSLRLDCVVSLAVGCSRSKAEGLVTGGSVSVSGRVITDADRKINEGDIFSVRGVGKFIFDTKGKTTKKERTFIGVKKFI